MEQQHFPELEFSEEVDKLFGALAKAQGMIETVERDREVTVKTTTGPSYKYSYATLGEVRNACRKPFAENGLALLQFPSYSQNQVRVITVLGHESGQWARCRLSLPVAQQTAQGIGSAITYARRYTWTSVISLASEEDDDGQAADAIQGEMRPKGRRNDAPAANTRNQRPEGRVPESSGDRAAATRPPASSKPTAPAAAPATPPAQPAAAPADAATAELRNVQKAWHAELRDHCGDLSTADRHAFAGALIGKPVKTETEWAVKHYAEAKRLLGLHLQECQGSPCGLLAKTLGLNPAAAPVEAPAPAAPATGFVEGPDNLEWQRGTWLLEVAVHAADFENPADRAAFASVLLNRQIQSEDGWTVKHYQSARKKLAAHAATCVDGECPLVVQAMQLAQPAADDAFAGPDPGATPPVTAPSPASSEDTTLLACSNGDCGKPLTKGQHTSSTRAFGTPLCPTCQRVQARAAA